MENTQHQSHKQSNIMRISLIVAIVIVMNLFFNYAVSFVYNEPTYDKFITTPQVVETITTKEKCIALGGQWNDNYYNQTPMPVPTKETIALKGYCDPNYTKNLEYQSALKIYERNVFITLVILGIISIVAGAFIAVSIIPIAFSWAGVLSLIIASMRYWSSADKLFKVIILAIALCILIWLAIKKFGDK